MTPRQRILGIRVTYADGRIKFLADKGGYFENETGERIENPTFDAGDHLEVVLPMIDERSACSATPLGRDRTERDRR